MDVRHSLYTERSVVRTWLLRGTLHLAAAEDVRWLLALLGPRFVAAGWRRRLQLGLDDAKCARGLEAIRAILAAQGPLTRAELVEGLASRGVALDPKGQDRAHLVGLAALQGILCLGPGGKDDDTTYALLDDWIPPGRPLQREAALAELARRYLGAYAPAGPRRPGRLGRACRL